MNSDPPAAVAAKPPRLLPLKTQIGMDLATIQMAIWRYAADADNSPPPMRVPLDDRHSGQPRPKCVAFDLSIDRISAEQALLAYVGRETGLEPICVTWLETNDTYGQAISGCLVEVATPRPERSVIPFQGEAT